MSFWEENTMKGNQEDYSRYGKRTKRKKTNIILNSLIIVVVLLIVIVSYTIFSGNDNDQAANGAENEEQTTGSNERADTSDNKADSSHSEDEETADRETAEDKETSASEDKAAEDEENTNEVAPADSSQDVVTEGGEDSNVIRTIENPSWQPVGTVQTEHPGAVYDSSSVDWQESVKAITYATGLSEENMTIMFLGNNGVNKSVATVRSKDRTENYRVYIDWVDGEGWKPVRVEELKGIE